MAGINLDANLGVKGFVKGTKDMEDALEGVADELESVGKSGENELDSLTDKIKAAKKAADDAAKSGSDMGDGFKKGTDKASDGLDDLNQNAKSNLKEVTASFDGSAESIADGFQGLAAEAFEGFGVAGVLAGAAIAAGIGLATKSFEDATARTEEYKAKVAELSQAYIESGKIGELSAEQVIEKFKELATTTEDGAINLRDIKKAADTSANSFEDLADALAGNTDNLDKLIESEKERLKVLQQQANYDPITQAQEEIALEEQRVDAQEKLIEKLKEQKQLTTEAAENEKLYLELGIPALEARAAMQETINQAYDDAAASIDEWINKETGIFDVDAYIASMQAREKALEEYQNSLAKSGLSEEAKRFLNEQGVEAASQMLEGYKNASPKSKKELARIWDEAGKEGSGAAEKAIKETFKTPTEAKVVVQADTRRAQEDLDNLIKARTQIIKVDFQDRYGKRVY
jgi:hypothetical protein